MSQITGSLYIQVLDPKDWEALYDLELDNSYALHGFTGKDVFGKTNGLEYIIDGDWSPEYVMSLFFDIHRRIGDRSVIFGACTDINADPEYEIFYSFGKDYDDKELLRDDPPPSVRDTEKWFRWANIKLTIPRIKHLLKFEKRFDYLKKFVVVKPDDSLEGKQNRGRMVISVKEPSMWKSVAALDLSDARYALPAGAKDLFGNLQAYDFVLEKDWHIPFGTEPQDPLPDLVSKIKKALGAKNFMLFADLADPDQSPFYAAVYVLDGKTVCGDVLGDLSQTSITDVEKWLRTADIRIPEQKISILAEFPSSLFDFTRGNPAQPQGESWMAGKIFVLTGFTDSEEKKMTKKIVSCGGIVKSSTVLNTDYVIRNPAYDHETTKLRRAKELISSGSHITILTGEEFWAQGDVCTPPVAVDSAKEGENKRNDGSAAEHTADDLDRIMRDPAKTVLVSFSDAPNFLNFRNRKYLLVGFSDRDKQMLAQQITSRGGLIDEKTEFPYCLVLNEKYRRIPVEYKNKAQYSCYIISEKTLQTYLNMPEGALIDPSQPPYTLGKGTRSNELKDVSATVTELDLSDSGIKLIAQDAFRSCSYIKKLVLPPTGSIGSDAFAYTEFGLLCFTERVFSLSHLFGNRPLPRIRMPLVLIGECKSPLLKQGMISCFLDVWAAGEPFDEKLQPGYDDYLRSQRKKYFGNDTAVRYLAARNLIPAKEALALAESMREAGKEELAVILEQAAAIAAAAPKKEKSATAAEDKIWSTKKLPDGTLRIRLYKGLTTDVVIPAQLKGLPVTEVGNEVFSTTDKSLSEEQKEARLHISSITVSEGIKRWGVDNEGGYLSSGDILSSFPELKKIRFPESLEGICGLGGIGPDVELLISNAYYGVSNAFRNAPYKRMIVPEGVTVIGNQAFCDCEKLTSVSLPESLEKIDRSAFRNCKSLACVTIPNRVTSIGSYAFAYCTGLTSVTIPDSVTSIGDFAFGNCKRLKSVTIPDNVTSIGWGMFEDCTFLMSVTIPDSVTSIGSYAFAHCTGLTSVTIPNSVTSIDSLAFFHCNPQICAPAGSCAERYAKKNGLRFKAI